MDSYSACYASPIGLIEITGTSDGLRSLTFINERQDDSPELPDCVTACIRQLDAYFQGTHHRFSLPLTPEGTEFQKRVWRELEQITYGETVSYGDIARAIGQPTACRAVGGANGCNPMPIIVPCHRVIGAAGQLTGYGSGLWRKKWLLQLEGRRIDGHHVL